MSEFRVDKITNRDGTGGTQICGVSTFSGTSGMIIPGGPTEYRGGRGRGFFGSGATPSNTRNLDMIEIVTTGDATDWGDDSIDGRKEGNASFASSTRGIWAGGYHPSATSGIVFTTMSSSGGVSNFGDLSSARYSNAGASDSTRGISFGGKTAPSGPHENFIDYVTIASTGDGTDFGNLTEGTSFTGSGINNSTRAIRTCGTNQSNNSAGNIIDYITVQSTGDATDFGDAITKKNSHAGCSNKTRGIYGGGQGPSGNYNSIEYITIATTGNGTDFGDLAQGGNNGQIDYLGACASSIRGVFAGGQTPTKINTIQFVELSSTGNTSDFGDLTNARRFCAGFSDCHGGLG